MTIQEVIDLIKTKENLSKGQIAGRLNVNQSYISDMIAGRKPVTLDMIERIQKAFPYCTNINKVSLAPKEKHSPEPELPFSEQRNNVFSEKNIEVLDRLLSMLEQSLKEKDKQIAILQDQVSKLIDK